MHTGVLTALEFDRVVEAVASFALTPLGTERISRLRPLTDPRAVHTALGHTTEGVQYLEANSPFPLEAPDDLDRILSSLAVEAQPLEPAQLLKLADFLGSVDRVCQSVASADGGPFPALSAIVDGCTTWDRECADVRNKVDSSGAVTDGASPVLKTIRGRLRKQRNRLRGNLESYLRGRDTAKYLQEKVVTERNGRFVLVVRSEHRTAIPGIVHGSSASGASLFLEPLSTVDVNNEIVALEEQERDEIRRVLLALSAAFRRRAADMHRTLTVATDIDLLQARSSFARAMGGVEPRIATDGSLELRDARHPLLMTSVTSRLETPQREGAPDEPVPVDIIMCPPTRALVITGPNTGGKTVALKTAGLLALMAQAGLHVPAAQGSRVPVFRSVFADIGDDQSIAANLSTFSGHVTNIVEMDRCLSLPALILLDEVGAGTDPVEGGALGRAVVEHFRQRGAHVVATTHDDVLKAYGATTEGVACAAFGFNPDSFAPTYELVYGSAGRSLALQIANRLGLDSQIIAAATQLRSAREAQLADHLERVDEDRRQLDELRRTLDQQRAQLAEGVAQLTKRETELDERDRANQDELERLLDTRLRAAREEVEEIVDTLRRRAAALEREAAERADSHKPPLSTGDSGKLRSEARAALEAIATRLPTRAAPSSSSSLGSRPQIDVGARVVVSTLGVEGAVRSLHGQEAEVEVHGKRVRVPLASLEETAQSRTPNKPQGHVAIQVESPTGPLDELNLIGCRVDEALSRAEKFLDQSLMSEQRVVRFIHGHGTGRLRRAIGGFLDAHPLVGRVSSATPEQGGSGVTIAELKE
ncbi:MAG TPA: endonuclease MutS2 [Vicinamibacterales bacterium]|nr:endonuclease MutS2 [Vicinamibacterales bacterium]